MKKMLIAVLVILPLASCTVHGNKSLTDENHQTVKLKIVKGKPLNKRSSSRSENHRHAPRTMDKRCGATPV